MQEVLFFFGAGVCTVAVSLVNGPAAPARDGNVSMLPGTADLCPPPQLLTSLVLPMQLHKRRKPSG